uniref:replication protein A 70 kDa DNA-binding subunit-like n=1 Tax=Myxine glutinosa TaxID=7769 RepID=UPI00358E7679
MLPDERQGYCPWVSCCDNAHDVLSLPFPFHRFMIGITLIVLADLWPIYLAVHASGPNYYDQSRPSPMHGKPGLSSGSLSNASPARMAVSSSTSNAFRGGTPSQAPRVVPISCLNPYQNKWTIRARVTNKTSIKTWSNPRGEGRLFSIDLTDEGGEIRATAFTDQCDKFHSLIELNKVYFISRATLKAANKQFTSLKNDYEMTFNSDTTVVPCEGPEAAGLPGVSYAFTPISDLAAKNKDTLIDVLGVCSSVEEPSKIMIKSSNRETTKREVQLVDQSNASVKLTIWGEDAEAFDGSGCPVLAVKGARVSDFNGCSLSLLRSSLMVTNPQLPEAFRLRGWFDREGHAMDVLSLSNQRGGVMTGPDSWKTLAQAKLENLGHGEKADYYSVKATVLFIKKDNCLYQACTQGDCRKKVLDLGNGMYRCEKCDRENTSFVHRMILQVNIADYTDSQWVTCFQETAEIILGQTTAHIGELRNSDEQAFDDIFQNANFVSLIFRLRVKLENFHDESRIKATVVEATPIDHTVYARQLIDRIRALN